MPQSGDAHGNTEDNHERLGLTPLSRIFVAAALTYVAGLMLGSAQGARSAALRFRAENSHRLPTRQADWYRYHRAKHAYVLLASMKEGNRMGFRLLPWVALFYVVEDAVDHKFHRDFRSTTIAAMAVAGCFGAWNRLPFQTTARVARIGLVGGIGYGLTQDALSALGGHGPSYLSWLRVPNRHKNDAILEDVTRFTQRGTRRVEMAVMDKWVLF